MTDQPGECLVNNWKRLAEHVVARRTELGLRQIDIPGLGGPSLDRVQAIESGREREGHYRPRTFLVLEEALGWVRGSVRAILNGGDPRLSASSPGWGPYVARLMADRDLSQAELARAAGVPQSVVCRWLGGGGASVENCRAVSVAFGLPLLEVLVGAEILTAAEANVQPVPASVEARFRDVARAVVTGQMEERINLAWQVFQRSLGGAS